MISRYFTAQEVEELVWENEVDSEITDQNRWSVSVESIVETGDGKFYKVFWNRAATESQEHEFWDQAAIEVAYLTKEIKVTKWFPVEDEEVTDK